MNNRTRNANVSQPKKHTDKAKSRLIPRLVGREKIDINAISRERHSYTSRYNPCLRIIQITMSSRTHFFNRSNRSLRMDKANNSIGIGMDITATSNQAQIFTQETIRITTFIF